MNQAGKAVPSCLTPLLSFVTRLFLICPAKSLDVGAWLMMLHL